VYLEAWGLQWQDSPCFMAQKGRVLPPRERAALQGRWEATPLGMLTVSGSLVKYDNQESEQRLVLSLAPDGRVALGVWRTCIDGKAKFPDRLCWTCEDDIAGANPLYWRRLLVAKEKARAHSRGGPVDFASDKVGPSCSKRLCGTSAQQQKGAGSHKSVGVLNTTTVPEAAAVQLGQQQPHVQLSQPLAQDISTQPSCSIEQEEAPGNTFEANVGIGWLLRPVRGASGLPTCAACCEELRPLRSPDEAMGLLCDVCLQPGDEDGAALLVCSDRDFSCGPPGRRCFYAVCMKCSKLPHSERQRHAIPAKRSDVAVSTVGPSVSIW